jgi:hypothetical protein
MKLEIFHYEDEPHWVLYPTMIETELMRRLKLGPRKSSVKSADERNYTITFQHNNETHEISYLIPNSIEDLGQERLTEALLHIVDLSINGDHSVGFKIYYHLIELQISNIWFLTGYAHQVEHEFRARNPRPRIIPKPARPGDITRDIVEMIIKRVGI